MSQDLVHDIVAAVGSVTGGSAPLHAPEIAGNEWVYVKECLDTEWVSSVGAYVDRFEKELAEFTGVAHAIVTVNGTAALHTCLLMAGVNPGDEVIVPALTFAATANAVAYCGAVPHFCDSALDTMGLDPVKLRAHLEQAAERRGGDCFSKTSARKIAAVVCMHTYGHPVDLDPLVAVCDDFGLALVEDAAESLGSYYKGRHTGSRGLLGAVSFNGNKIVTTGGGGAVLTDDADLASRAKHLTTTAKVSHKWEFDHDQVGYNYRMPNINAAMGCAQLEQTPGFLKRKRQLAERYADAFKDINGVTFFEEPRDCESNYWLNVVILDEDHADARDAVLQVLNEAGYMSRPAWKLNHELGMYKDAPRADLSVAESFYGRLINIPSNPRLV